MDKKELKEMFEKNMKIEYDESAEEYPSLLKTCKDFNNNIDLRRISFLDGILNDFIKKYYDLNLRKMYCPLYIYSSELDNADHSNYNLMSKCHYYNEDNCTFEKNCAEHFKEFYFHEYLE